MSETSKVTDMSEMTEVTDKTQMTELSVFVTGATGALGRPVVERLLARGHRVRGLARSAANERSLRERGVEPVRADLFDPASLRPALAGIDAVLHLATKIPPLAKLARRAAWRENDRIRRDGTRALVEASRAAGVKTVLYPSIVLVYPSSGDRWIDAQHTPITPRAKLPGFLHSTVDAEHEVERFSASGGRGITLRMGLFYGPRDPNAAAFRRFAQVGIAPLPGEPPAYFPSIWIEDAAEAVVAALEHAPAGVYDVVDDAPLTRAEANAAIGMAAGRRRLFGLPAWLVRLTTGVASDALQLSLRVSNRRLRQATGWQPSVPDAREGWKRIAATADSCRGAPAAPGARAAASG